MINLMHYNPSPEQKLVLDKYGWHSVGRVIDRLNRTFWRDIHLTFFSSDTPDNSNIDTDIMLVDAVLDYIFQNDVELQEEYEKEITNE